VARFRFPAVGSEKRMPSVTPILASRLPIATRRLPDRARAVRRLPATRRRSTAVQVVDRKCRWMHYRKTRL
jgi:hypothetical protein